MSTATKVKGQGVGSAYIEQVGLVSENLKDKFEVTENQNIRADITHYHTINLDYYFGRKFRTSKGKSVGYVHMLPETVETSINIPQFAKKAFYWYMLKFYDSMDYLVTVNPYFIGRLEHYGIDRKKVTYIPNYVSSEVFHPVSDEEKAELREKYNIPQDKFVVVCAGQLQVRKGFFDFMKMVERMPDVVFVWAGGFSFGAITDGYKEITKVIESPPENLRLLGIIERKNMNEIYNIGDVMFLPSFEELFPMTILEAMCAHTPILLRDLEIYNDILFDFYSRADDVEGFISEVTRMKNDKEYYAQCVSNSIRGNEFYSKEHVAKMWDDFYTMVNNSEPPKTTKSPFNNKNITYKSNGVKKNIQRVPAPKSTKKVSVTSKELSERANKERKEFKEKINKERNEIKEKLTQERIDNKQQLIKERNEHRRRLEQKRNETKEQLNEKRLESKERLNQIRDESKRRIEEKRLESKERLAAKRMESKEMLEKLKQQSKEKLNREKDKVKKKD